MLKPFPTEMQSAINPESGGIETVRNLFCTHYDDCLNEAVKKGWNSFTCVRCPMYALNNPEYTSRDGIEVYATQRRMG